MSHPRDVMSKCLVEDNNLRALLDQWHAEQDQERRSRLEQTVLGIVEERERTNFIVRFILCNYDSWHNILTEAESNSKDAHGKYFYEPHLIAVLEENEGKLEPVTAIQKVLERVKGELRLSDFAFTKSKRFRYDTTIRFLADDLKKRGVLSRDKKYKGKVWALEPRQQTQLFNEE